MLTTDRRYTPVLLAASLAALATFLLYLGTLDNGFVEWDDKAYVTGNVHIRSFDGRMAAWAFTHFHAANWHPLTWISHAADYALWGPDPRGHHLTNNLLHAANTFLVVLLAAQLLLTGAERFPPSGGRGSGEGASILIGAAATGLLFGIHPLHVESAAWVAERKDLLCALFFLLSVLAYLRSARAEGPGDAPMKPFFRILLWRHRTSFLLFIAAILSKPMAITLPAVLLLLDWYPLGRIRFAGDLRATLMEKLPFVAVSAASSVVTILAQRAGEAIVPFEVFPFTTRLLVAVQALASYLGKALVPGSLLPYYAYPASASLWSPGYLVPAVLVAAATAGSMALARRRPLWAAVWAYYVVTLLPVLGIIQVGNQAMADRYMYLPSIGPFLLPGIAAARTWDLAGASIRWKLPVRAFLAAVAFAAAAALALATQAQIVVWKDGISLWNYVISKDPGAGPIPYNNRGELHYNSGRYELALADLDRAVSLAPADPTFYNNRGLARERVGMPIEALADYTRAIELSASYAAAYYNRGILSFKLNRPPDESLDDFDRAISLDPRNASYYNNRGIVFAATGRPGPARADFSRAIEIDPDHVSSYLNRGLTYQQEGRVDRAREDFQKACDAGSSDGCDALRSL